MKYTLTAEEHTAATEEVKAEYTQSGDSFTLKLEGHEEAFVPKSKWSIAEEHRKTAEKDRDEEKTRSAKLATDLEAAGGNSKKVEELRANFEAQKIKIQAGFDEREKVAKDATATALKQGEADKFAQKFTTPTLISKAYMERLSVEDVDGVQVIRTKDAEGKASVGSLDDLQKEFLANPEYADIVKVNPGSGGGAHKNGGPTGGAGGNQNKKIDYASARPADLVETMKAKIAAKIAAKAG